LLFALLFALLFIAICAGGEAARSAQSRAAQGEFAPRSNSRIVISLLLTMPWCGSAAHDTKRHRTTSAAGRARVASPGKMLASILARFGGIPLHDVKQPGLALAQCVVLARRAGPSALGIVSGRPLRMRIFVS
jgi:hypothetical protein